MAQGNQPRNQPPKSAAPSPAVIVALLVSAVMLVVLGTILPGMMAFDGPEGLIMQIAFYVAAAGDVAIALWFRSKLKKARAASGGTIQRQ